MHTLCLNAQQTLISAVYTTLDEYKQVDMKPASQPEQAGCGEWPKGRVLRMLARRFLCNVNYTKVLLVFVS